MLTSPDFYLGMIIGSSFMLAVGFVVVKVYSSWSLVVGAAITLAFAIGATVALS